MNFKNIHVLLTDGSARQTLAILRGLKEIGCKVTVMCSSKWDVCYASRYPDNKILSRYSDSSNERFFDYLLEIVKKNQFDVLLVIGELATNKVTENEQLLKEYVKLACAPRKAYIGAYNKQITFEKAIEFGVPQPNTRRSNQTIDEYIENAHFPIIIKPRQGMGSIGFHKFNTIEEFRKVLSDEEFNIDDYVVQEFIDFEKRIDAFIFIDQRGEVKTSMAIEVLRWYPLDAGTSTFTRTVDNHDIIQYGSEILRAINYQGFADVSFMIDKADGKPKLMEINGRIPAGVKLSFSCGYNVARQLVEMAFDRDVIAYPENDKIGMCARHSQVDLMWFIKSSDRFKTKPSWFSWKNTTDLVFWKDDPFPYIRYSLHAVVKLRAYEQKRNHR